jgi:glycosyltransferase involved in cell wall biosynthesis
MRIAYIPTYGVLRPPPERDSAALMAFLGSTARQLTGSRNMLLELERRGVAERCETWLFWTRPTQEFSPEGTPPITVFACDDDGTSPDLERHIASRGAPDVLWVEGRQDGAYLDQALALCQSSFRLTYTQYWKPWKVDGVDRFQLCLVDEERHVESMRRHRPGVRAAVWDKLIDHEGFRPLGLEKAYDLCYVAYLRPRKEHELLFRAMAALPERRLKAVCVGGDRNDYRRELERMAGEYGVDAHFTGEADRAGVNEYVNRSRIGVICSRKDAAPRALLEYMAADVPVLVNAELRAGTRYVAPRAGLVCAPERFHEGIAALLDRPEAFQPRAHFLEHYSRDKVVARLVAVLREAGLPVGAAV